MSRVVVVGSFNLDQVWTADTLPRPGETLAGRHASGPGGKGFNQAVAAARAGAGTTLVCALGQDEAGRLARELAAAEGLELQAEASQSGTGTAGIFVDAAGRNCIVVAAGANASLGADFIHAQRDAFTAASVLLVQLESPLPAVQAALECARRSGVTTLLDPAPADVRTSPGLLALADLLTPNETELCSLVARHLDERLDPGTVAALDDASLHVLCRRLLPHGRVVVTLGGAGCFLSQPADAQTEPDYFRLAAAPARVIDSTGAGDAFNGALAAALALDGAAPLVQHLQFANRYAAVSTERPGAAVAMPRRVEVDQRFGR